LNIHNQRYLNKIKALKAEILQEIIKWQKLAARNSKLRDRIEDSEIMGYLRDVSKVLRDYGNTPI